MKLQKLIKKQPQNFFTTANSNGVNIWALVLLADMIEKEVKQIEKMEKRKSTENRLG